MDENNLSEREIEFSKDKAVLQELDRLERLCHDAAGMENERLRIVMLRQRASIIKSLMNTQELNRLSILFEQAVVEEPYRYNPEKSELIYQREVLDEIEDALNSVLVNHNIQFAEKQKPVGKTNHPQKW